MKLLIINKKMLIVIFIFILVLILSLFLFTMIKSSKEVFNEDIYYKGSKKEKVIAFVCNVDWGNEYIQEMLDIFSENDIRISFFITGQWAEKNPELVRLIQSYNHEIGNHGYKHLDYSKLDYNSNIEEISKANNILKDITGFDTNLFGPPSGAFNKYTLQAAKDLKQKFILWSIDTIDWREDSTKELIINRVITKADESAIVLMHPTANTVKALPEIINSLFQKGYIIGTISDVIE